MAKRKRAAARRARASARESRKTDKTVKTAPAAGARRMPSRRLNYSPALLAHGRRLYEETDTPATEIAADFGIDKSTLSRLAQREGWVRYVPPPRGLPPRLQTLPPRSSPPTLPPRSGGEGHFTLREQGEVGWRDFPPATTPPPIPDPSPPFAALMGRGEEALDTPTVAAHLRRSICDGLALLDRQRGEALQRPDGVLASARIARTLASLTDTLERLARIEREAAPPALGRCEDCEDIPEDIDEFRLDLARRINAFVASRDGEDEGDDEVFTDNLGGDAGSAAPPPSADTGGAAAAAADDGPDPWRIS